MNSISSGMIGNLISLKNSALEVANAMVVKCRFSFDTDSVKGKLSEISIVPNLNFNKFGEMLQEFGLLVDKINNINIFTSLDTKTTNCTIFSKDYSIDNPGIKVNHPSESGNFIVQGSLVTIEKIEQQPGEDAEKLAERIALKVERKLEAKLKRNKLTVINKILTT